jgi:hypothetical protein
MRKGVAMVSFASDGTQGGSGTAGAGDEIVVPETTAAFLVRQRSADIIEVIEEDPAAAEPS